MAALVTTSEYWSVLGPDGVDHPLNTPAYNIETWGDDRQSPPSYRGDNLLLPYQPGELYVAKLAAPKTRSLAGWVIGESDSGVNVAGSAKKQKFHDNWANLRSWLAREGQFQITKRWVDTAGVFRTATAMAEFAGGLSPSAFSPSGARFTVDLTFADPYFYGPAVNIAFDSSSGTTFHFTGTILGDTYCRKITVAATSKPSASVTNPRIDVTTTPTPNYWYYQGVVANTITIALDARAQSLAIGGSLNGANNVVHSGYPDWLLLNPGTINLVFSAGTNNWVGTLTYLPTYW